MDFWSMPVSCAMARRSLAESSVVLVEKMRSGASQRVLDVMRDNVRRIGDIDDNAVKTGFFDGFCYILQMAMV